MTISVVLADDQPLVRAGFRLILEAEDDFDIVGEAGDGGEAVVAAQRLQPHVVLMDVQMPQLDGLEATRRIAKAPNTRTRVLILTTFERDDYVFDALRAGASGFMLKNAAPEELVRAVRIVAAGEALLAPSITRRVIDDYAQRSPPVENAGLDQLTERELEVLRLLATGKSNAELAATALPRRRHRQDARLAPAWQAGPTRPGASGCLRLRTRPGRARSLTRAQDQDAELVLVGAAVGPGLQPCTCFRHASSHKSWSLIPDR